MAGRSPSTSAPEAVGSRDTSSAGAVGTGNTVVARPGALTAVAVQFVSGPVELRPAPAPPVLVRPDWPAMLTRAELCDYLGLSWSTLKHVLTVPPVDLGGSMIRYRRDQIDEWVKSRPPRLGRATQASAPVAHLAEPPAPDTRLRALERARRRAQGR